MDMESLNRTLRRGEGRRDRGRRWAPRSAAIRRAPAASELFQSGAIGKVSRIEQCRNGSKPYWYSWMRTRSDQGRGRGLEGVPHGSAHAAVRRQAADRLVRLPRVHRRPVANLGCHFIDLFNYIVGTTLPTSCVAQGGTFTWKDETTSPAPTSARPCGPIPKGFMVSYSTNFGNGSGSVLKIYGDQGTIDLTNWAADLSGGRCHQAQQAAQEGHAVEPVEMPDHFLDWLQCLRSRKRPTRRSRPATTIRCR